MIEPTFSAVMRAIAFFLLMAIITTICWYAALAAMTYGVIYLWHWVPHLLIAAVIFALIIDRK